MHSVQPRRSSPSCSPHHPQRAISLLPLRDPPGSPHGQDPMRAALLRRQDRRIRLGEADPLPGRVGLVRWQELGQEVRRPRAGIVVLAQAYGGHGREADQGAAAARVQVERAQQCTTRALTSGSGSRRGCIFMCPGPLPLYLGYLLLQLARVAWLPRGGARRELPLPLATAPTSPLHAPLSRAAAASLAFHHSGDDRLRYAGMLVRLWFSYGRTAVHLPPGSQFTSPAQPRSSTKLPCPVREGALLMEFAIMAVQLVDGVVRFSAWGRAVRRPWTCSSFLGVPRFQNCSVVRRPVDVQFGAPVVVLLNMAQKFILFSE